MNEFRTVVSHILLFAYALASFCSASANYKPAVRERAPQHAHAHDCQKTNYLRLDCFGSCIASEDRTELTNAISLTSHSEALPSGLLAHGALDFHLISGVVMPTLTLTESRFASQPLPWLVASVPPVALPPPVPPPLGRA